MAIKVETIEVDLEVAGAQKAATDVKQVTTNTDKMTSSLKSAAIQGAALFAALKVGARILGDVYDAVVAQDTANRRLKDSLRITGAEVDSTFARFETFAGSVQKLTGLADDSTLSLLAQATQMGLNADEAEKAAQQAIGLSVAFGTDVASALKIAALAGEGEYEMLGRLVPSIRSATTEAEKSALAQKVLNNAWMIAQENTRTLEGATTNLKNSYGDLIEAIVDAAVDLDNLISLINDASAAFQKMAGSESLQKAIDGLRIFKDIVMLTINPLGALVKGVRALINANEDLLDWSAEDDYWSQWLENEEKKRIANEAELARLEELAAARGETSRAAAESALAQGELENALFIDSQEREQQRVSDLSQWYTAQKSIRDAALAEELQRTQTQKDAQIAAALTVAGVLNNLLGAAFGDSKLAAVAQATINTALAITRLYTDLPIWAAIAATPLVLATMGAQISKIKSQSFATGTPPGGYTVPPGYEGDNFPVMAKSGETVNVTRPGTGGGQMLYANISIDGYQFGQVMTRVFEDRKASIPADVVVA